ncbi:hypothetical protein GCM10027418_00790 [Mariniluteicoccus endophyticus]
MSITAIPDHRPPARRLLTPVPDEPLGLVPLPLPEPRPVDLLGDDDVPAEASRAVVVAARAVADLAARRRTAEQLRGLVLPNAHATLCRWAAAQDPRTPWTVRSLRAQRTRPGVVEACVRLQNPGGRSIALAVRMEARRGRWVCTVAEIGGRRGQPNRV